MDQSSNQERTAVDQVEPCDDSAEHEHLMKALHSLSAGIARIERKLDRILALAVELRTRPRL